MKLLQTTRPETMRPEVVTFLRGLFGVVVEATADNFGITERI